jgi:hypothetical protein
LDAVWLAVSASPQGPLSSDAVWLWVWVSVSVSVSVLRQAVVSASAWALQPFFPVS